MKSTPGQGKKRTRRFLRFSLRSAFIGMTAICALTAVYVPIERQRQAVKHFRKVGGEVAYEECHGTIKNWLRLHLGNDFVSNVRFVNLGGSRISDDGLRHLADLPSLQVLWMGGTKVGDAGLKRLHGLRRLVELDLRGTRVSDTGLRELRPLTTLQTLHLAKTRVTAAGMQHLQTLKDLQFLSLEHTNIPDAGLQYLSGLTRLGWLHLDHTKVSDKGLAHLNQLKDLQVLNLNGTQATSIGTQRLMQDLPDCHIILEPPPTPVRSTGHLCAWSWDGLEQCSF